MMNDEQRHHMIQRQKAHFFYGEVTYEAGLEIKTIKGWFGYIDLGGAASSNPFMPSGSRSGPMMITVILDIDTLMTDQQQTHIPFERMIEARVAPEIP